MKQFRAARFVSISAAMTTIEKLPVRENMPIVLDGHIPDRAIDRLKEDCAHLDELGLHASAASLDRLITLLEQPGSQPSAPILRECGDLTRRLQDELDRRLYFSVDSDHQRYFTNPEPFGPAVSERFSSAIVDIEESGRCIALNRSTAAVFHLMRVMELGLRVVGASLNDPSIDPVRNPTWSVMLRRFDSELRKSLPDRSSEWRADEAFFAGVASRLYSVKDAWRNPTMHVQLTYTEEQAMEIYNNVSGFMRHIATKLSE